jgi:polysaccharide biosynthesis protein PslH
VTIVAFGPPGGTPRPLDEAGVRVVAVPPPPARSFQRRLADIATTTMPDLARRLDSPAMSAALAQAVGPNPGAARLDVIQVEGLEMARYFFEAAQDEPDAFLVYDAHNAEWVLQDRAWRTDARQARLWHGCVYSMAQTWKLRRFEHRLLGVADATVAVSDRDREALRAVAPTASIHVVPNGVDTEHYQLADPERVDPGLCVFTGKMDFRPNVDAATWFCRDVWPLVRRRRSDARLEIVGRDPVPRVRDLASASVAVTGAVPDVRPHLARAGVVVVPLRVGGGTRLKVLEAMAMGKAIAATSLAVEGLDVQDGREALVADSADRLAASIVRLQSDPSLRVALGEHGRATAVAQYEWASLVPGIETLYDRRHGR